MASQRFEDEERIKRILQEQVVDLIENGWLRSYTLDAETKSHQFDDGRRIPIETVIEAEVIARDKDGAQVEIRWTRTVGR